MKRTRKVSTKSRKSKKVKINIPKPIDIDESKKRDLVEKLPKENKIKPIEDKFEHLKPYKTTIILTLIMFILIGVIVWMHVRYNVSVSRIFG